jgi:hypothetical protein
MIKNDMNKQPSFDFNINFAAYKCRFAGCLPPVSPAFKLPVTQRSKNALFWSNISTWEIIAEPGWAGYKVNGSNNMPKDGDNVKIPQDFYVVVDCPLPKMNILQIDGILELDNGRGHVLQTNLTFINGGQLIIGWEKNPINTSVEIILTGEKDAMQFKLPDELSMIGGKGIGVYGGLDIHGTPRLQSWSRLKTTARSGTNNITLERSVDWKIGILN